MMMLPTYNDDIGHPQHRLNIVAATALEIGLALGHTEVNVDKTNRLKRYNHHQVQAFLARHTATAPRVHADLNSEQDIFEASREGNVARYNHRNKPTYWQQWLKPFVVKTSISRVEELLAGGDADVEDLDTDG